MSYANTIDDLWSIAGNGMNGLPAEGPFDCIHVGAAFIEVADNHELINQLAIGGRMLIPIGKPKGEQDLVLIEKIADTSSPRYWLTVATPRIRDSSFVCDRSIIVALH